MRIILLDVLFVNPFFFTVHVRILYLVLVENTHIKIVFIITHTNEPYLNRLRIRLVRNILLLYIDVKNIYDSWLDLSFKVHEYLLAMSMLNFKTLIKVATTQYIESVIIWILLNEMNYFILQLR